MNNIDIFKDYYNKRKKSLEIIINEYNNELSNEENLYLKEYLEYFTDLNRDGKLIRGILVGLGYSLLNDNIEYSNKLSLAYEVFQTSILIHDDIIDKDIKRRGKETIPYRIYNKYKLYSNNKDELKHLSNSIGICVGDYGLYLSNKIIIDNYKDNPNISNLLSYFNDTVLKTIKGEILDVITPYESKNDSIDNSKLEDNIMNIYRLKTAYYTIIGPLSVGIILSGGDKDKVNDITLLGEKIGIAFQIQDDILGIYKDDLGKVIASDIKEFKQTLMYSYISKTKYRDDLLKYYGNTNLDEESISKVRELFKESGSLEYATTKMNNLYEESIKLINNISWIGNDKKILLKGFVEYLKHRNK